MIFFLVIGLMYCYHCRRKEARLAIVSSSYYFIFAFIVFWIMARLVYLTDAFVNYPYKTMVVLGTLPTVFTFVTISIALYNL